MKPEDRKHLVERNLAIARACGLEVDRLESFAVVIKPNERPVVRAIYVLPDDDELVPLLRLFTLVEDIAHIEVPAPEPAPAQAAVPKATETPPPGPDAP